MCFGDYKINFCVHTNIFQLFIHKMEKNAIKKFKNLLKKVNHKFFYKIIFIDDNQEI